MMKARTAISARLSGALLFAIAGAAAGAGAVGFDGELDLRRLREAAPLAALVGGLLGYLVSLDWPRRAAAGALRGMVTALIGVVFFSGLYLFGDAVIEAALGGDAGGAVADAMRRLSERLPLAVPLALLSFGIAGFLHWALGVLFSPRSGSGRGRRRARPARR